MKTSSRFVPLLFLVCLQYVIPCNQLGGCPCPQVTDLFKLENLTTGQERPWPQGAQKLLQQELEKLWALSAGQRIITQLRELLRGQRIELRSGQNPGADLDKKT